MTKNDIACSLSKLLNSKKEADIIVNKMFEEIITAIRNGEKVVITGFGSFNTFETKIKNGRNPKTGQRLLIAPMKKIKFKPSKDFFEN
ncbi:MAG: integration host factor subunit beta [Endomicrobium sp.]|jgi:nucleoid DNA-binding protein|nr:integration host factor subunit beta [Endomicrobium sp.]